MSHRVFEIAELRRRIAAIETEIAAVLAAHVVDFGKLLDLKQTRCVLINQLEVKEK